MARVSIDDALGDRRVWLDHQAEGTLAVRRKALHDLEDAARTELRTRTDYAGRYPVELLQNAHDACADAAIAGTVRFVVTPYALLVANEGESFNADRIVSLVRQGSSEKAEERSGRRTIGYKGIGFSSVFEVTDQPQIISAGKARFQFDRSRARTLVGDVLRLKPKAVAARAFPFEMEPGDWADDAGEVDSLLAAGAVTVIRLPLRPGSRAEDVAEAVERTLRPEALIFMPAVKTIELRLLGRTSTWARRRGQRFKRGEVIHLDENGKRAASWLVSRGNVRVSAGEAHALDDPAWEDVRLAEVIVGLPWSGGVSSSASSVAIHVYFPTEERTGRSILVHGDFFIDSRRAAVTLKGVPGDVNRRMAAAAARLLADLAESQSARYCREVCAALAAHENPSAFGELLGAELIEALRSKRLVRVHGREAAVRVAQARRTTDLGEDWEARLLDLIRRKASLVLPGVVSGRAAQLLDELGLETLEPETLARRVGVPVTPKRNEQALATLDSWLDQLSWTQQDEAERALAERPILLDQAGSLRRAREVVLSIGNVPALPPTLSKHVLRPLADPDATALVERLEVEHLDTDAVLGLMLEALEERRYGRNAREHAVVLRFFEAMWETARTTLAEAGEALGIVRVPACTARGGQAQWVEADSVYFGRPWREMGGLLEAAYGPFGEAEFLAADPPSDAAKRRRKAAFYAALGVASQPRTRALDPQLSHYESWCRERAVQAVLPCPDGHPDHRQSASGAVMDRLDELLARAARDNSFALARMLNSLEAPYGQPAEFRCNHRGHGSAAAARAALGYQRWRLRSSNWVPVRNDPDDRRRRSPSSAWVGVPRTTGAMLIPTADFEQPSAALELVNWSHPTPDAVEGAMSLLRKADLDRPGVISTADRLLKKLETSLTGERTARSSPPVLCHAGRSRQWSDSPVVPDLPRLERLPSLTVLSPGDWPNLRRVYDLPAASSVVRQLVARGPALRNPQPLLPRAARAKLLAVLGQRSNEDMSRIATRLARIREQPTRHFELRLVVDGTATRITNLAVHLVERPAKRRGLPLADLYYTPAALGDLTSLVPLLQTYLRTDDFEALWFALTAPDDALTAGGIDRHDVREARELLSRRRPPPVAKPDHLIDPEEEEDEPEASTEGQPGRARDRSGHRPREAELPSPDAKVLRFGDPVALAASASGATTIARFDGPPPRTNEERVDVADASANLDSTARPPSDDEQIDDGISPGADKAIEQRAVEYVAEYGRRALGATVKDVQTDRVGWDLEFHMPDGSRQLVEVKGSSGAGAFAVTTNELRQAQTRSNWSLFYAFDLASPKPSLVRITGFEGLRLEQLVVHQYSVPHWRHCLHCEEIPLEST